VTLAGVQTKSLQFVPHARTLHAYDAARSIVRLFEDSSLFDQNSFLSEYSPEFLERKLIEKKGSCEIEFIYCHFFWYIFQGFKITERYYLIHRIIQFNAIDTWNVNKISNFSLLRREKFSDRDNE
jgi:hypothetical protein